MRVRLLGIAAVLAVLLALIAVYVFDYLVTAPPALSAAVTHGTAHLMLQSDPSYGHAPDPDWVTYMGRDRHGHWRHTTIYRVPAHTLVTVTIDQYDTATGLRNPFMAQVRGTVGGEMTVDGRTLRTLNPNLTSHTFTIPELGIDVPLPGVSSNARNQCSSAPCTLSEAHTTITFSFRSPGPGTYHWQCFVPCAAGFYLGFGGPMQTLGWMSGEIKVT